MGALTVIWKVNPVIVTGHLIMGFGTACLYWILYLQQRGRLAAKRDPRGWRWGLALALLVLLGQILLGGWTSTNYAALACPDFPTCQGSLQPELDFKEAFTLWRGIGPDYEGGVLDNRARVTIQYMHRLGALLTAMVLALVAVLLLLRPSAAALRQGGAVLLVLLLLQLALGIGNVVLGLPLAVAVAHNGVAALLLLTLVNLNYCAWRRPINGI